MQPSLDKMAAGSGAPNRDLPLFTKTMMGMQQTELSRKQVHRKHHNVVTWNCCCRCFPLPSDLLSPGRLMHGLDVITVFVQPYSLMHMKASTAHQSWKTMAKPCSHGRY